jgi:hypothetical protein
MNKTEFNSSIDFENAKANSAYLGITPVEPKLAADCLKDSVDRLGEFTSATVGSCAVANECTFMNDKLDGISGICLKSVVGVEQSE